MCDYETLYHDQAAGYIIRCTSCEKLQLGYGNLAVNFTEEDFQSFRKWLQKINLEQQDDDNKNLRNILIPTPCEDIKFLVSRSELNSLNNMLEKADSELRSLELIKLFHD